MSKVLTIQISLSETNFNKNLETYGNFASNKGGNDNSFFSYAEFKVCVMTNSAPPSSALNINRGHFLK